jgi:hypothetical protein
VAYEGFDTTSSINRKMTIEEYKTSGSWVFQLQQEDDQQEMPREQVRADGAFSREPASLVPPISVGTKHRKSV